MDDMISMAPLTKTQINLRKRWVKALRSGKYVQGTGGYLGIKLGKSPMAYCCLGVACVVLDRQNTIKRASRNGDPCMVLENGGFTGMPGGFLQNVLGITDDSFAIKLAELNDSGEYTFEDLADIIELDTLMCTPE
mgnify:CR=1 FL=1